MDKPSLKALRELHEKATPIDESVVINRYEHGGGRVYKNSKNGTRNLIADFYEEPDRECWISARNALPALLAIAEAVIADRKAQGAVSMACLDDMDSEEAQAAFQRGHDADKALAAALALVEE